MRNVILPRLLGLVFCLSAGASHAADGDNGSKKAGVPATDQTTKSLPKAGAKPKEALLKEMLPKPPQPGLPGTESFLALQEKVQTLLPKVRPAVVAIFTGDGTASGVIMNEDGLILTAAHVAERPGRELRVILEDGSVVKGTTLGLDKTTDAALMQINESDRKWPHVNVSRQVVKAQPGEWCFALGYPGGFDEKRGVVLRVGRIVRQTANALQTDCVLMGGDSGGPLFDLNGDVIGIHSLIWEGRNENMHVSMAPFLRSWDEMKSSLVIHTWGMGSGGYLGVATEINATGALEVVEVIAGSPSELAGLKNGDIILALDGENVTGLPQFTHAVRQRPAGDEVCLRLGKAGLKEEREVKIKLGLRPREDG